MSYKLIGVILFFIVIVLVLSAVQYLGSIGGPTRLGVVPEKKKLPCRGELTVSATPLGNGKCRFEAEVRTENCEGKDWYVFQGDKCLGTYICKRTEVTSPSQWKCIWEDDSGSYTFTLCIDWVSKALSSVTC